MASVLASILLALAAILNVVATTMLTRSEFESRFQKLAQFILIWVPLVGAVLVIAVLSQLNTRLGAQFALGLFNGRKVTLSRVDCNQTLLG